MQAEVEIDPRPKIVRDRFTLASYLTLGFFLASRSVLAPFVSYGSAEQLWSDTLLGLHITAAATGIVIIGLGWDRVAALLPQKTAIIASSILLGLAALGLIARHLPIALAAAFVLGAAGSVLNVTLQSALSDRHGPNRSIILGEAAAISSIFAALTPLAFALCVPWPGLGWRWGLLLPGIFVLALLPLWWRLPTPGARPHSSASAREPATAGRRLPPVFWLWAILLFLCSATEWVVVYWGATFIHAAIGLSVSTSTLAIGLFLAVSIAGKAIWSRLSHRFVAPVLIVAALIVAGIGLALFWLLPLSSRPGSDLSALAGLCVFAVGISGTSQLGTAAALEISIGQSTRAMSRVSLSAGLSVILFPPVLGAAAENAGIQWAFAVPAATGLLALTLAGGLLGHRRAIGRTSALTACAPR